MIPLEASWIEQAAGGSMLLALPVAALAGVVSFFSPCVLPLLPGYLSYATGLTASDLAGASAGGAQARGHRGRIVLGTSLFILGFAFVFVSAGALFGGLGWLLQAWSRPLSIIGGVVAIALGLTFAGVLRFGQSTWRISRAPAFGLAAAPVLGIVFGVGWTPCIGPTLGVVMTLAANEGTALRGAVLSGVYALGLGVPFLIAGLAFDKMAGTVAWVRRHHDALQKLGGAVMIAVGVLLVSGIWDGLMGVFRQWASAFGVVI